MQLRNFIGLALATSLAAACSPADDATEESDAAPAPTLTSNPTPTTATDGTPLARGEWFIEESASGASAAFGPPQSEALLVISCDAASGDLALTMAGDESGTRTYVVEAGGEAARLDMSPTGGELPMMRAEIALNAPVFGGFTNPEGIISLTNPAGQALRVPAHPGIQRVFFACQ